MGQPVVHFEVIEKDPEKLRKLLRRPGNGIVVRA
jgi:hypothetical protein